MSKHVMIAVMSVACAASCDDGAGQPTERTYQPEQGVSYVSANGAEFAYLEAGDGPLVLLLHGFPDTARTWDEVRPALAEAGYRAVSPFMRGYAPSEVIGDDTTVETLGRDVLALIDALGAESAIVVGHDWGASAAYAAASIAPEKVSKLVTVAIPHPAAIGMDPSVLQNASHFIYLAQPDAEALMSADDFAHVDELYQRWSPTWSPPPGEFDAVKNAFSAPGSLDAALGYYRAASPTLPDILLSPITAPTLAFAGLDDGVLRPEVFDAAAFAFVGTYEVARVPGGHFLHRESPQQFIDRLLSFLAE